MGTLCLRARATHCERVSTSGFVLSCGLSAGGRQRQGGHLQNDVPITTESPSWRKSAAALKHLSLLPKVRQVQDAASAETNLFRMSWLTLSYPNGFRYFQ
jgi:hypothetical protein